MTGNGGGLTVGNCHSQMLAAVLKAIFPNRNHGADTVDAMDAMDAMSTMDATEMCEQLESMGGEQSGAPV